MEKLEGFGEEHEEGGKGDLAGWRAGAAGHGGGEMRVTAQEMERRRRPAAGEGEEVAEVEIGKRRGGCHEGMVM